MVLAVRGRPEHARLASVSLNLFAGIAVGDFGVSLAWYQKLLGGEPAKQETYANGVRKVAYVDPDGSEIAFGEVPR